MENKCKCEFHKSNLITIFMEKCFNDKKNSMQLIKEFYYFGNNINLEYWFNE